MKYLLTGIKNKAGFAEFFNTCISDQYRNLYSLIYIGFDIVRVNQYYGEVAAEEQLCFATNELKLRARENECVARVSGGGFAVARPCGGERDTELWLEPLLEQLNRYTERYGKDYRLNFEAGIYMLQPTDRNCGLKKCPQLFDCTFFDSGDVGARDSDLLCNLPLCIFFAIV